MTPLTVCQSSLIRAATRAMLAVACSSRTTKASIISVMRLWKNREWRRAPDSVQGYQA